VLFRSWWVTSAPTGTKALTATLITAGVIFAGYELTGVFSSANAAETYTYVQTVRQVRVAHVTDLQPTTVLQHGRIVTVDPPPRTVFTPPVQQLVTITTSHVEDRTETQTLPVTRDRFTTVAGPGHTVEVTQTAPPVTRTATVAHTVTVTRSQTVTAQQAGAGQTVVSERTVTETNPVTTTVSKSTTVPVTSTVTNSVTQTVTHATTETVTVATTTTVPVTTTVTHTVTSLVTVTSPITVTVKTST